LIRYTIYILFCLSGIGGEEDDEKENHETSPSIKTTSFMTKEREALSANDTNTSADISGINSLDTSKADSTKESGKNKLKVSINFHCNGFILDRVFKLFLFLFLVILF
jgi:hypothetical protein